MDAEGLPLCTMPDWLWQRAETTPDRLALVTSTQQLSFRELETHVARCTHWLACNGVQRGTHVATLLSNGLTFAALVHAVPRLGATLVPLNVRLTPVELAWQLRDVAAKLLIFDTDMADTVDILRRDLPDVVCLHGSILLRSRGTSLTRTSVPPHFQLDDVRILMYTSGTTGRPKGAMLSHGNFWHSAVSSALNLGLHLDDRWLAPLPLFHVGGLSILLRSVIYGITAEVHERFDPLRVNRAIDEDGVTIVSVVSVMLQRMLDDRHDKRYPSSLRCVLLGGGPAPRSLLQRCWDLDVPVMQTYGLTETTSQIATIAPEDARRNPGPVGKPLFGTEIRIDHDHGTAPSSQPGEILVRGPVVSVGYWKQRKSTDTANGWFHTGDIGFFDAHGYLWVLDRRDDLIISGGENVYPAEVETVLMAHPAVEDAGVFGIPDEQWGQVVAASVKVRINKEVTVEELRGFCRSQLAPYKVPATIRFTEQVPRTASGKLLRRELRS